MKPVSIMVDVQDLTAAVPAAHLRRVVALMDDNKTVVVGSMTAGEEKIAGELTFSLGDAGALARDCLSGHRRALTTPGLARILSSTVALLLRVSLQSGAIQSIEGFDDGHGNDSHPDDRSEADGDGD